MPQLKEEVFRRIEKAIRDQQNYSKYKEVVLKNINELQYIKILVLKFKAILGEQQQESEQ